jgi:16S rRNA (adenine1518-N6/adenine1519-N6)-dimethyltransferase
MAREGKDVTRKERIIEKLQELGAEPKRSLGQNFLISDAVVDRILTAARSQSFSELVEVGPGLGALTDDLLRLEKPLTLIELDRRFAEA